MKREPEETVVMKEEHNAIGDDLIWHDYQMN